MNKQIDIYTNYGDVIIILKTVMDEKNISISRMSRISNTKYDVVKRYYYGESFNYNADILAKFCYILDCKITDILKYVPPKVLIN